MEEVSTIMNIFRKYLVDSIERSNRNNMRVIIIRKRDGLREDLVKMLEDLEKATAGNTGLQFTVAINYGGRDELVRAAKNIAKDYKDGIIAAADITEDLMSRYLDTREITDPDLLIRTSGELRTSNFLPWQIAYSEFYFTDCMWPDFDMNELVKAVRYYTGRDRRYGGVK